MSGPAFGQVGSPATGQGNTAGTSPGTNDPVEAEFRKIMEQDDAAQEEAEKWIQENQQFAAKGVALPPDDLKRRILKRIEPVKKAYEDFLEAHPDHAKARVAYASFLGDIEGEEAARVQLEKALEFEKNDPAIYNNLAVICAHIGPVTNAFACYEKAIQLNPREPLYYHSFGTVMFLFRMDAMAYYQINEEQVFGRALALYSNAMRLDPTDFPLASDVAQTYYGIKPLRTDEALNAWTNALKVATQEVEREGVYIHLARIKLMAGRYEEARTHLSAVTNRAYSELRTRVLRNVNEREKEARETNGPPAKTKAE